MENDMASTIENNSSTSMETTTMEGTTIMDQSIPELSAVSPPVVRVDEDHFRPIDSVFATPDTVTSFSGFDRRGIWYFKNNYFIETDDLNVEAHFNEVREDEFSKIQKNIVKNIINFKNIFGLGKGHRKETLEAYLFNDIDDYTKLGSTFNFTYSFGVSLAENTLGMAFQKPFMIFTTKNDMSTLNHEMAHALNYHAVGFKAQCLWNVFNEGLAEYFELYYSLTPSKRDSHIRHTFNIMVNTQSKKNKLDEIREALNPSLQFFKNQNVNLYSIGYSLVSYLQEKNSTLIKDFFFKLNIFDDAEKACQYSKKFADELHKNHDQTFKDWLRIKYDILEGKTSLNSDLHEAARDGNIRKVWELINKTAHMDAVDRYGWAPLHYAARGHLNIVRCLLRSGADVNAKGYGGNTSLHEAAKNGRLDIIQYLVEKGADYNITNTSGDSPLYEASGNLDIIKYLIERGADFKKAARGDTPLHQATYFNHLDIVKYLVEKGADMEARHESGNTALHGPCAQGHTTIVEYLVERGAKINTQSNNGNTPLHVACLNGHLDIVKYLVENGSDYKIKNKNGDIPLHEANGRLDIIKYLVEKGSDFKTANRGDTPLYQATWYNNLNIVKYLVEKGADIEAKQENGNTPLHAAAIHGYLEIVKYFIEKGANINAKGYVGNTPLHEAGRNGHLNVAKYLVEKGADLTVINDSGDSPLYLASGHLDIIKYLIERGADFQKASRGDTPLHQATWFNHLDIVKYLIEKGADMEARHESGNTALNGPCQRGNLAIVKYLVEKGAQINPQSNNGNTPLHEACLHGHLDIVKYLVEKGADITLMNNYGNTPLYDANGRLEIIKYLIERGADFKNASRGDTPLHQATWFNHLDIVKYLVEIGADIEARHESGNTTLHGPCIRGHYAIVKYLVERGAKINPQSNNGKTPLHEACLNGHLDIVKYLVEKGADLTIRDNAGNTPLSDANGRLEIIKYLIEKGADFKNASRGDTPLHQATWFNHLDIVKYLVEKGADLEARHESGNTPLQGAAVHGFLEIIKYLVEKGAKVNTNGYIGFSPLHEAAKNGHLSTVKYLVEKGADTEAKDNENRTPLKLARENYRLEVINFLEQTNIESRQKRHSSEYLQGGIGPKDHKPIEYYDQRVISNHAASGASTLSSWFNLPDLFFSLFKERRYKLVSKKKSEPPAQYLEYYEPENTKAECRRHKTHNYMANMWQSKKLLLQDVSKECISNASGSSGNEKVTSNFTAQPQINATTVNNALILGMVVANAINKTQHKQPLPESLLAPREQSMKFNNIDDNMILQSIQQQEIKFGWLNTDIDEVDIGGRGNAEWK